MGLLDDLRTPQKKVWPCAVREIIASLEKGDAQILAEAVMNPEWKYSTLENALRDKGIRLGQHAIKKHRTKGCSCA